MTKYSLRCIKCSRRYGHEEIVYTCECGGLLDVEYDYSEIDVESVSTRKELGVWKYKELLPFENKGKFPVITLNEGNTPLYMCRRLSEKLSADHDVDVILYVKHEGLNPTGSFKDRGMTVGVTKALELGMKKVGCASTGNTSASLSVYAALAGIRCIVILPAGKIALGKLSQAMMHGAEIISIKGNFDDALKIIREICPEENIYLLNSVNPYRLEGQKTIAFEIAEQLSWSVPDRIILPVGMQETSQQFSRDLWS